jgi:hypothetical protein
MISVGLASSDSRRHQRCSDAEPEDYFSARGSTVLHSSHQNKVVRVVERQSRRSRIAQNVNFLQLRLERSCLQIPPHNLPGPRMSISSIDVRIELACVQ